MNVVVAHMHLQVASSRYLQVRVSFTHFDDHKQLRHTDKNKTLASLQQGLANQNMHNEQPQSMADIPNAVQPEAKMAHQHGCARMPIMQVMSHLDLKPVLGHRTTNEQHW
jgi:hypothetical protein